jgi:hypothetical protein
MLPQGNRTVDFIVKNILDMGKVIDYCQGIFLIKSDILLF